MEYKNDIGIIIPFMGTDKKLKYKLIEDINSRVLPELKKLGLENFIIQPVDENFRDVDRNRKITYSGKVSKGRAVRDGIKKLKREHQPKFILHIDGSGRIAMENLVDLTRGLMETDCGACIGKRINSQGVSTERITVEKFENFILEEKFNCKLPDAQCGCWGFNCTFCENIKLTAEGYEIEWDFLKELLKNSIDFTFIPVNIAEGNKTLFKKEDHRKKISFIINSLELKKWEVNGLLEAFNENDKMFLPSDYVEMVKNLEVPEKPKKRPIVWRENSN